MNLIFVYAKNGKIKALSLYFAQKDDTKLKEDGWVHTATIDPVLWLNKLCNDCDDVLKEIGELKGLNHIISPSIKPTNHDTLK